MCAPRAVLVASFAHVHGHKLNVAGSVHAMLLVLLVKGLVLRGVGCGLSPCGGAIAGPQVILVLQNKPVRFRGVNLSGENLSKLVSPSQPWGAMPLLGPWTGVASGDSINTLSWGC